MKLHEIDKRSVRDLSDGELAKVHSQVHGMDKQSDANHKKRERETWEAHDALQAEMLMRNMKHDSPFGAKPKDDAGDGRADSNITPDADGSDMDDQAADTDTEEPRAAVEGDKDIVQKPLPNYHACRIKAPGKYKRIRYAKNEFGTGVDAVYGVFDKGGEETSEVQAIRFKKTKFTAKEAKAWAKEHDYTCKPFEAATGKAWDGERVTIGKAWFLLENMRVAIKEAFSASGMNAYMDEIDLDGPAVIVNAWESEGSMESVYWRIPFTIDEEGNIELDMANKKELERQTVYVTKIAPVIKESIDSDKMFALFVAYVPFKLDSQGEWASPAEIEKMAHDFGRKCYVGVGENVDMNHDEKAWKYKGVKLVENIILRNGMGKQWDLPDGTWLVGLCFKEDTEKWEMLKDGKIGGVSIGGRAKHRNRSIKEAKDEEPES